MKTCDICQDEIRPGDEGNHRQKTTVEQRVKLTCPQCGEGPVRVCHRLAGYMYECETGCSPWPRPIR